MRTPLLFYNYNKMDGRMDTNTFLCIKQVKHLVFAAVHWNSQYKVKRDVDEEMNHHQDEQQTKIFRVASLVHY